MKRSALFLPALALALSLVATGCGGGSDDKNDSSDEPAASAISSADFLEQANQICADGNVDINAAGDALGEAPTAEEIAAFSTDVVAPNVQDQHDAIADLGAPEGDEDAIDALLTALQEGIDALTADPAVITADAGPFEDANAAATDLGLTECAG
jgi:hypothetical protein